MRERQRLFAGPFAQRIPLSGLGYSPAGIRPFGRPWRAPWRAAKNLAPLGRLGTLEARLARSAAEVRRAQGLRYHVFYEEMSAIPDMRMQFLRRDLDPFDLICDHLLVIDHQVQKRPLFRPKGDIVGTYRLLRQKVAEANGGFYSAGEFDVAPLIEANPGLDFLELGRSCVLKPYRNKRTVELLWHGVWSYVLMHGIDVMIGCASLEGTDPDRLALPLSFLHHNAKAPPEWNVRALDHRYVDMNRMPASAIDPKEALKALPPLVKGYLRLGAYIGDGAVVDHQFGTTDVMMILPVSVISPRYINHYGADAGRYAS
ncbi:GNAT family N-acyltransferase [Propylenella binzhouense]|uniref:L-ornithine N(alpha)-acyltransferase n=1 Tax=Propylenella binzhouense TaxID=2555902 RepID=A0A964T1W1_9HYPH|nr:GNAT family N-acetyltransferase [Propylenella binzhouense]